MEEEEWGQEEREKRYSGYSLLLVCFGNGDRCIFGHTNSAENYLLAQHYTLRIFHASYEPSNLLEFFLSQLVSILIHEAKSSRFLSPLSMGNF